MGFNAALKKTYPLLFKEGKSEAKGWFSTNPSAAARHLPLKSGGDGNEALLK